MDGFVNPEEILEQISLEENMQAAEFGCGSGKFAFALAKKLKKGKVYALDVQKEPLSAIEGRLKSEGFLNIEPVQCDLEKEKGSGLAANSLDLVLIPNMLFQAENKQTVLAEAKRVLKKGGRVLAIDWKLKALLGPKEGKVSSQQLKEMAEETGLSLEKEVLAGSFHYGLLLFKKD